MTQRVAIIGTRGYPSYYGGFETAIRHLAPYLAHHGWDVTVYSRAGQSSPDDPARDLRVHRIETPGIQGKSLSTLSYGLTSVLHALAHKPDVALVMNCANGLWIPLLRLRGIPVITNVDGIEWQRQKWGATAKLVFKLAARMTARFSTELIFDAKAIARHWKLAFNRDGVFIPYGGDPVRDLELLDDLTPGSYVLLVARFVPENTVGEFLAAIPALTRVTDVVLVGTTGTGGDLDEIAAHLERTNPRVHWLGHISDDRRLYALWQNAGVYYHGHSVGGTNPALVQAMALGSNIVARDTIYNREVLGGTAHYCEPSPQSILNTILESMSATSLGPLAAARANEHYTWDRVCAEYDTKLREIANQR